MGVEARGFNEVINFVEQQADRYVKAFLDDLNYVGLQVVKYVRNRSAEDSWVDQTGNLRSSIGYVLVRNGQIVNTGGFDIVNGPKRDKATDNGSQLGLTYAERLAAKYTKGYALIIVAGMDYASYVEAMENKDVLKSGEFEAKRLVKKLIAEYERMKSGK